MLGMSHLTSIQPGSPADFNIFDATGRLAGRIRNGRRAE
jgi:hypothetical protein